MHEEHTVRSRDYATINNTIDFIIKTVFRA